MQWLPEGVTAEQLLLCQLLLFSHGLLSSLEGLNREPREEDLAARKQGKNGVRTSVGTYRSMCGARVVRNRVISAWGGTGGAQEGE